MEHARPTLAATALAATGLLVALHVLHPGEPHPGEAGARARGARVVAVTAEAAPAATILSDPPARLRGPEPAGMMADSAAVLAPRPTVPLPANARTPPRLPGALVPPPAAGRGAAADPIGDLIRGLAG